MKTSLLLIVTLLLTACAPIHTGAVNAVDSNLYDSLVTLQAAIESAKTQVAVLPALKGPLNNQIIPGYNVAWHAYADYHTALVAGTVIDPTTGTKLIAQVQAILAGLNTAIAQAKQVKP